MVLGNYKNIIFTLKLYIKDKNIKNLFIFYINFL